MKPRRIRSFTGIGLVDLMVGLVLSLIAMLVILKVAVLFEARRKSTVGMADAQLNAAGAMTLMARDIRMAGQGLGPPESLGCDVQHDLGVKTGTLTLTPVTIIDGDKGAPDTLRVLASASPQIVSPATLIADHPAAAGMLLLDSTLGIEANHLLVLYESGKICSLFRATAVPVGGYRVDHDLPAAKMATPYLIGARAINLGGLRYTQYSVDTKRRLQIARYSATAKDWVAAAMASEVVSLQAQYGFDTRSGPLSNPQVTRWSSTMLNADGLGIAGDNGDLRRLLAIRLAIVVRSAQRSDLGCNSPAPQWIAADEATGALTPTDINLTHITDWACFRYRVLQTEIPLRNLLWSDS